MLIPFSAEIISEEGIIRQRGKEENIDYEVRGWGGKVRKQMKNEEWENLSYHWGHFVYSSGIHRMRRDEADVAEGKFMTDSTQNGWSDSCI